MNKINWVNGQSGGTPLSAENLNLMQDNIEDAIDENTTKINQLENKIPISKKIWANSNSTTSFNAQTIVLDEALTNYDAFEIIYRISADGNNFITSGVLGKNYISRATTIVAGNVVWRTGYKHETEDNKFIFTIGQAPGTTNANWLIPHCIIAYKNGIVYP